jgi:hypothetical protein
MYILLLFIIFAAFVCNLTSGDPQSILFAVIIGGAGLFLFVLSQASAPAPDWQRDGLTQQQAALQDAQAQMGRGGCLPRLFGGGANVFPVSDEAIQPSSNLWWDQVEERGSETDKYWKDDYFEDVWDQPIF